MKEAIDVGFDIFWALVISVVAVAFVGTAVIFLLVTLVSLAVQRFLRRRGSQEDEEEEEPSPDVDALRITSADPHYRKAA